MRAHPSCFSKTIGRGFGERQHQCRVLALGQLGAEPESPVALAEENEHLLLYFDHPLTPWKVFHCFGKAKRVTTELLRSAFGVGPFHVRRRQCRDPNALPAIEKRWRISSLRAMSARWPCSVTRQ